MTFLGPAAILLCALSVWACGRLLGGRGTWRVTIAMIRRRTLGLASYRFRLAMVGLNAAFVLVLVLLAARGFLLPGVWPSVEAPGRAVILYLVVGLVAWPSVWSGFQASSQAIRQEQMLGTLETTVATPAGLESLPFGSLVFNSIVALVTGAAMLALGLSIFGAPAVRGEGVALAIAAVVLGALFVWGIGLAVGALTTYYKEVGGLVSLLRFILILFTGAYFPVDVLPPGLAAFGRVLPLTWVFDLVRTGLFRPLDEGETLLRVGALTGAALLSAAVGTRAFKAGLRAARRAGVLQGY